MVLRDQLPTYRPYRPVSRQRLAARTVDASLRFSVLAMLIIIGGITWTWAKVKIDDVRYGMPRQHRVEAFVGHESGSAPTQLIAMNLQRQVIVYEIPGGDPARTRFMKGPYLVGAEQSLTPVTIELIDVNNDTRKDMLVNVSKEVIAYINEPDPQGWRLATPEERTGIDIMLAQQEERK